MTSTINNSEDHEGGSTRTNRRSPRYLLAGLTVGLLAILAAIIYQLRFSTDAQPPLIPRPQLSNVEQQVADKIQNLTSEIEKNPSSADAWGNLAMTFDIHDFKQEAATCYQEAARLNPKEFRWAYYSAIVLTRLASDEAFRWFEQSLLLRPDYVPLHIRQGRALLDAGQTESARQSFGRALKIDAGHVEANFGLAKIALSEGNLDSADKLLSRTLESEPKHKEALAIKAEVLRRKGETEQAAKLFQEAQKLSPILFLEDPIFDELLAHGISATWYRDRGMAYLKQGYVDEAIAEFKRAMELRPDYGGYNHIANLLRSQGKSEEATRYYQMALEVEPNFYEGLTNLAETFFELGELNEAIALSERSMQVNLNLPHAYLNLSVYYFEAGQTRKALDALRIGMRRTKKYPPIVLRLAWLLAAAPEDSLRDGRDALRVAKIVTEEAEVRNAESLDVLAICYAAAGEFNNAVATAEEALNAVDPNRESGLTAQIQQHLDLFKARKPFIIRRND